MAKKKKRELNKLEIRVGRSSNYWQLSNEDQWAEDRRKDILDWDGTEDWLNRHGM